MSKYMTASVQQFGVMMALWKYEIQQLLFLLSSSLTNWSAAHLEKLTVSQRGGVLEINIDIYKGDKE
jgi:hypothetical protein